jgi:hypothetical protein
MEKVVKHVMATVLGVLLALADAAYMLYLRVPSVLEIRPELADVGLVAGLFGGRPMVYLFHDFTVSVIILNVLLFILMFNILVFRT